MSLDRKSIVIYASAQNLSSDLRESKVSVQTVKKQGLEKFYSSVLSVVCSQGLFFFFMLGGFLFNI